MSLDMIFISALQNHLPAAVLHGVVHAAVMLVIVLLEILADLYCFCNAEFNDILDNTSTLGVVDVHCAKFRICPQRAVWWKIENIG